MSDNIKVVVKVRPLIPREIEDKLSYQWRVKNDSLYQINESGKDSGTQYTFDKVYDDSTKTADVYKDVAKPIVEAAIAGFNGTIFAYGQTSSGKTYTMSGTDESPGIIQLSVVNLFDRIKCIPDRDFLVRVSYIEIYNEKLKDLLNVTNKEIKVRDTLQGVKVDATEKFTSSPEEVMEIMKEGEANRAIGATLMNEESSRSHSLFQITIESREHTDGEETAGCVNVSTLNLVDLAGSERSGQTGATGIRFKEGTLINKSLSTLALVIKQLSEDPHKHANYRDSKLTRILQNSLGGNAKTSIICAITPAAVEETISTLQFANRAKAIKNKPEVNAVATDATKLQHLTKKLAKLQSELALKNVIEQDNLNLQKQISGLQKMILNGFGQQSRDAGARRKTWCAPRRMTISTLPSVEEGNDTAVQRFCTPSLKYNPLSLASSREFLPIRLAPVSEEAIMTTPPKDKKVNFNDEIIDLDSDEDNTSNTSHCSPHHKCYKTSKTPPCVLRKNAKTAEKNLKEIVELTNREKVYTPELVEYMEKLEKSSNKIVKLEDDLRELGAKNLEKDCEVKLLQEKIVHTENEVKKLTSTKTELESRCKESHTKITDLEVSYETLTKKAKLRENELLSLLSETQQKQPSAKDTKKHRKNLSRTFDKEFSNFMDMSKDISLVSDHDSSMETSIIAESSTQLQDVVTIMKTQILQKDEAILNLENDLQQQKLSIKSLENMCEELRVQIIKAHSRLEDVDKENSLLKTSVETLNSTIKSQKLNLESANNDIQNYNSVIEELKNRLSAKTNNVDLNINDNLLETMIEHEEKVIANNENLKNIIQSFKIALDMRSKEIDTLKSTLECQPCAFDGEFLAENLQSKDEQINKLLVQVQKSQEHIDENMSVISQLMQKNEILVKDKDDLSEKILNAEKEKNLFESHCVKLQTDNENSLKKIQDLSAIHDKLMSNLKDLHTRLSELEEEKEELCKLQVVVVTKDNLISDLKSEMKSQDGIINALNNKNTELQSELNAREMFIVDLKNEIQSREKTICSLTNEHTVLQGEVVSKDNLIADLKHDSLSKDSLISSLSSEQSDSQNYLQKFKSVATKIQKLLSVLTGDLCLESEIIDDSMAIFNTLCDRLNDVEITAKEVVSQKELAVASTTKLEQNIETLQAQVVTLLKEKENAENKITEKNKEIARLTQDLEKVNVQLNELCSVKSEFNKQLETVNETNQKLCTDIEEKENIIISLENEETSLRLQISQMIQENSSSKTEIERLQLLIHSNQATFNEHLHKKEAEKAALKMNSGNKEHMLEENCIKLEKLTKELEETIRNRDEFLTNLNIVVGKLLNGLDMKNKSSPNSENINLIFDILETATNEVISLKSSSNDNDLEFEELKQKLNELQVHYNQAQENLTAATSNCTYLTNQIHEIKMDKEKLSSDLHLSNQVLQGLKLELKDKVALIENLESKIKEWRENFSSLEESMKQQILELQETNFELQSQCSVRDTNETYSINRESSDIESFQRQAALKLLSNIVVEPGKYTPQSLLTLCCTKIMDTIQPSETSLKSENTSNTDLNFDTSNIGTQTQHCDCDKLRAEIETSLESNLDLKAKIQFLEYANLKLLQEQEEIRKELQLLVEPAHDLQKKISNHRTNLSTLTATTYAENKLLKSQVKVLQHHNNRFFNVCQKDFPVLKKSLQELSVILKSTTPFNRLEAIKRYSLPEVLDTNSSESNYKDESTLDGDLLMLDTNVTIASVDNTLLGVDQTCLDGTHIYDAEINTDLLETIDPNILHTQLQMLTLENQKQTKKLKTMQEENFSLHEQLEKYANVKLNEFKIDAQNSPIKLNHSVTGESLKKEYTIANQNMVTEIELLTNDLLVLKNQNSELKKKCEDLNADIITNDKLLLRIAALEKDNKLQLTEIDQLAIQLSRQKEDIKNLQDENDSLSTQVMENIDESEGLRKELEVLEETKSNLTVKCADLEVMLKSTTEICPRCRQENKCSPVKVISPVNRSRSDSESTSRFNKLSTLQNELQAGREDCKTISEDVATIKSHLEHGNLPLSRNMDMDDSMGESNAFALDEDLNPNKSKTQTTAETPPDMYTLEKMDCLGYYVDKTGTELNNSQETKIIDILKLLYNNLIVKHGNEIDNLVNKLKDFEAIKNQLQENIINIEKMHEELKTKNSRLSDIENIVSQIKDNMYILSHELPSYDADKNAFVVEKFKNNLLKVLDTKFQITSVSVFESIIDKVVNKHQSDLEEVMTRYTELQSNMELLASELSKVTDNLNLMKGQLADKEKEYNLLKAQKNKVHEITNAVTLDLIQKKKVLSETITKGYEKLIEYNIVNSNDVDGTSSEEKCILLFVEKIIELFKQNDFTLQEKHKLLHDITIKTNVVEEKELEIESLKSQLEELRGICKKATDELFIKNEALESQRSLNDQLNQVYEKKVEENKVNMAMIENLTQELVLLKEIAEEKGDSVQSLQQDAKAKISEITEKVNALEHENEQLKSVNEMLNKENEQNALSLAAANETIQKNKSELDKMTAEVLLLNQSVKENVALVESLKLEAKSLFDQNVDLKEQFREANELCSQLKSNMKTHEKTAEIQCKIMNRLKQEKEDKASVANEKTLQVQELTQKCEALQQDCKKLSEDIDKSMAETRELMAAKETLERRVSELEGQIEAADKARSSLGSDPRRRRQSLLLQPDHKKMEAYFSSSTKPEDLFMDVDEHSNRSTPVRSRRSDSFQSRNDESERDEAGSRPGSARARRRRRQSTHDQHRLARQTPDHLNTLGELNKKPNSDHSEVSQLKETLELCRQELEELRERYKEVDEECETCAEYLRERDEQCAQLKNENKLLHQQIAELNGKIQNSSYRKTDKCSYVDISVNTDEDWANLHSVVVDRMSFDREVEKNKSLQRSVDELRYKNAELKLTLEKSEKKMERAARVKANSVQELEATKSELESCKLELRELKERCKELDEECEICGEYLRERDEQIARLKAARDELEAKLEELQSKEVGSKALSVRKKRQSIHDRNRNSTIEFKDASTETNEDLLSYQVERDNNTKLHHDEMQQLKLNLERLSQQNAALEMQLRVMAAAPIVPPVYVATGSGVVQNQHLTDVMKENQKLKNINAKLITICKKRGKPLGKSNRENDDPADLS